MKILWVDDRASTLEIQKLVIEQAGHSVEMAESAHQATEMLKYQKFDLAILDIMMPDDGLFGEMETMGGMRTGIFFAQYVRLHFPDMRIAILSISDPANYDDELLFSNGIERFRKQDFPGKSILELVERPNDIEAKYKAIDVFEIKPGMFGLKVDIKKFIQYLKSRRFKE